MKLITVEAEFALANTPLAIDAVEAQASVVRAMDGCIEYKVYRADPAIAIVQKWQSMQQFDVYRGSDTFAGLIGALKTIMSAPPVTTIANVDS